MTTDPHTILIVIGEDATRTFLADNLAADGYEPVVAENPEDGRRLAEAQFPDLAIVDLGLPGRGGYELVASIRNADLTARLDHTLPVLVLGCRRDDELDCLRGFECGADDYIARPFSYPELRARASALLRRAQMRSRGGALRVGALEVDPVSRQARVHGELIELSNKEFVLLRALATEPTRVFTKEQLMRTVWGVRTHGTSRTLDSHACRLRRKLASHGDRFVISVWGVGYCLAQDLAVRDEAV